MKIETRFFPLILYILIIPLIILGVFILRNSQIQSTPQWHEGQDIKLQTTTPLFSSSQPAYKNLWGVLNFPRTAKIVSAQRVFLNSLFEREYTPIVRSFWMYQIDLTQDIRKWIAPQIYAQITSDEHGQDKVELYLNCSSETWPLIYGLGCFVVVILLILWPKQKIPLRETFHDSCAMFLLSIASMMLWIGYVGVFYIAWPDFSSSYLKISHCLSTGDKPAGFPHPIGWPLLQLPFLILSGQWEFFQAGQISTCVNVMLMHPMAIVFIYLLARNLTGKRSTGLLAGLLFLGSSWVMEIYRWGFPTQLWGWIPDTNFVGFTKFAFFIPSQAHDLGLYRVAQLIGLNPVSDSAGLAFLMGGLFFLTRPNASWLSYIAAGASLGFSFAIRVNNVLCIPAVACFYLWQCIRGNIRRPLGYCVVLIIAYIAGIMPQILENIWLSGNPFILPYHLYDPKGSKGFLLSLFPFGMRYLSTLYFQLLWAVALALLYIRDIKIRLLNGLFILLYFGFFAGYACTEHEEVRFVLAGLVIGMITLASWLTNLETPTRSRWITIVSTVFLFMILIPVGTSECQIRFVSENIFLVRLVLTAIAFLIGWLTQNLWQGLVYTLVTAAFCSGIWFIPVAGIIFLCGRDLMIFAREIYYKFLNRPAQN